MKLNKMKALASKKGFTLIELMIVIAIIGILAAVAIPNYIAFRDKAYCSGAESDANAILGTLADYYAVPANTGQVTGSMATNVVNPKVSGVTFHTLSNGNTATISTGANGSYVVTVTDVSGRCPTDYMDKQSNAGWDDASSTFTKIM